jgi:hypothetical protein
MPDFRAKPHSVSIHDLTVPEFQKSFTASNISTVREDLLSPLRELAKKLSE